MLQTAQLRGLPVWEAGLCLISLAPRALAAHPLRGTGTGASEAHAGLSIVPGGTMGAQAAEKGIPCRWEEQGSAPLYRVEMIHCDVSGDPMNQPPSPAAPEHTHPLARTAQNRHTAPHDHIQRQPLPCLGCHSPNLHPVQREAATLGLDHSKGRMKGCRG